MPTSALFSPRRLLGVVLVMVTIVAGCSSDIGTEPSAAAEALETLERLDAPTRNLVEFEATWQCDLTRFAFSDLAEIDELRLARQIEVQITPEAYEAFVERLDTEPELAELVSDLSSDCSSGAEGETGGPVAL